MNGEDAYPIIRKAYNDLKAYEADAVRFEILKHFGCFATESPKYMSKYVPYFRKNLELVKRFLKRRWDCYDICVHKKDALDSEIQEQINGNVKNTGLITNLRQGCCVEVSCLVDNNGINPC